MSNYIKKREISEIKIIMMLPKLLGKKTKHAKPKIRLR
jgi:hypothetical protein